MTNYPSWESEFRTSLKEESIEMGSGSNVLYRLRKMSGIERAMEGDSLKVYISNKENLGLNWEIRQNRKSDSSQVEYQKWAEKLNKGSISLSTSKINAFTMHKENGSAQGIIFTFSSNALKRFGTLEPFNWDKLTGSHYGDELEFRLSPHKSVMSKDNVSISFSPANKYLIQVEIFGYAPPELQTNTELKSAVAWCVSNRIPVIIYEKMFSCLMGIIRFKEKTPSSLVRALWKGRLLNFDDDLRLIPKEGENDFAKFYDNFIFGVYTDIIQADHASLQNNFLTRLISELKNGVAVPIENMDEAIRGIAIAIFPDKTDIELSQEHAELLMGYLSRFFFREDPNLISIIPGKKFSFTIATLHQLTTDLDNILNNCKPFQLEQNRLMDRLARQLKLAIEEIQNFIPSPQDDDEVYSTPEEVHTLLSNALRFLDITATALYTARASKKDLVAMLEGIFSRLQYINLKLIDGDRSVLENPMFSNGTFQRLVEVYKHLKSNNIPCEKYFSSIPTIIDKFDEKSGLPPKEYPIPQNPRPV